MSIQMAKSISSISRKIFIAVQIFCRNNHDPTHYQKNRKRVRLYVLRIPHESINAKSQHLHHLDIDLTDTWKTLQHSPFIKLRYIHGHTGC